MYEVGMLCKHFKGKDLYEKNIYRIIKLGLSGNEIDEEKITYSGDNELKSASNLVIYANIFQDNKLFAREYEDISSELSDEKKQIYNQTYKVQPLTPNEIELINNEDFILKKKKIVKEKILKKTL